MQAEDDDEFEEGFAQAVGATKPCSAAFALA
eukprot:COSAG06_NODE_6379_length_2957_cov_5.111267_1_plen_30_part_10